jgi:uncharacterized MnhB-related membrane protein
MAVLGAISLILQKHPIHSALSLIVVMVALAGLYLLMGAEFVAAVQIIVYGGAIMVLFVFVIMSKSAPTSRSWPPLVVFRWAWRCSYPSRRVSSPGKLTYKPHRRLCWPRPPSNSPACCFRISSIRSS